MSSRDETQRRTQAALCGEDSLNDLDKWRLRGARDEEARAERRRVEQRAQQRQVEQAWITQLREELQQLRAETDRPNRSPSDVAGAYQGLYEELHNVPRGPAKMAVEGACWYDRHVEGLPLVSGDDQYIRFGEPGLHGFIHWVGELLSIKTPELRRQTIVAAMYGTWIKNEREARKFFEEVGRGGEEYTENPPTTVLDAWLKAMAEKRGRAELKPANLYQGCIFAWNAFREGKSITAIKHEERSVPRQRIAPAPHIALKLAPLGKAGHIFFGSLISGVTVNAGQDWSLRHRRHGRAQHLHELRTHGTPCTDGPP